MQGPSHLFMKTNCRFGGRGIPNSRVSPAHQLGLGDVGAIGQKMGRVWAVGPFSRLPGIWVCGFMRSSTGAGPGMIVWEGGDYVYVLREQRIKTFLRPSGHGFCPHYPAFGKILEMWVTLWLG